MKQEYIGDIPKYRKKRPQVSKSTKRSDHKHLYEKTITMHSHRSGSNDYYWSTHCSICGRPGNFNIDNDDFRLPEWKGKARIWAQNMCIPFDEVVKRYPDIPIYRSGPDTLFQETRIK